MKGIIIVAILLAVSLYINSQDLPSASNSVTIVFYNVDNLFDISNDLKTNNEEFTPGSPKQWNDEKYKKKISDLSKVISSVNEKELPCLIGLAEVENKTVLEDLTKSSRLKKGHYGIVHFDSRDERGLDVALLYDMDEIELVDSKPVPVIFGSDTAEVIPDILYVKCHAKDGNIYHVFVNQWPSRSPNEQDSEAKRITAAVVLRKEVDNILNFENNARIIILGDFNDEPTNKSVLQILGATNKRKNINYRDLFNLMYDIHNSGNEGSMIFNDVWQMFDQIIVSPALFRKADGYWLTFSDGRILKNEMVLTTNTETGIPGPKSTFTGDKYLGGASDHLPVYIILRKEK
jgi:hypothetical protein